MTARTHIRLDVNPLDAAAAHAFVSDPSAGAVVVFTGTVRRTTDGREVRGLDYEAFVEEAEARMGALAQEMTAKWPVLLAVWLEHRVGTLAIGEPAVVVGVSAPHRPEAFDAARYGIDTLKATIPIWKKEHWADGDAHWPS